MRSPFDDVSSPRVESEEFEEVGGAFACQERGCLSVVPDAKYHWPSQTLTWLCSEGHICKIEGFRLA